jgi:hypothetical protein
MPRNQRMKTIKHCERKALEAPVEDRFVLAPAPAPNRPKGVSLFDQPVSDVLRRAPPAHPNTEVVQGLSAHVLREHYRASFQKDPGQMGKAKLLEAFLRPGAPFIGNTHIVPAA